MAATQPEIILVTDRALGAQLSERIHGIIPAAVIEIADTIERLSDVGAQISPDTLLICYGTGIIVPKVILDALARPAINFHAAPPEYPGRDPHHWAVYEGAREYGVTAHEAVARVDAGPIIAVDRFPVPENAIPEELLKQANAKLFDLFVRLLPEMLRGVYSISDEVWAGRKRRRSDFIDVCNLNRWIDSEEFDRRYRAFDGGSFDNLTVDLHGKRFRIDKQALMVNGSGPVAEDDWQDFTLDAYRNNLRLAKKSYRFAGYKDSLDAPHVLWRHDVDFSVHQALVLARIESDEQCKATYFLSLHSAFYNLLESEIIALVREIVSLGHEVGLHFDASAYPGVSWTYGELEKHAAFERSILEAVFGVGINALSFHNPDVDNIMRFDEDLIGGMVSAYGRTLKNEYEYCSDSNGYWRFEPLPKVLADAKSDKIQVLTHPAWWVKEPMSPRQRIERCVSGRAATVMRDYDESLRAAGRKNL